MAKVQHVTIRECDARFKSLCNDIKDIKNNDLRHIWHKLEAVDKRSWAILIGIIMIIISVWAGRFL